MDFFKKLKPKVIYQGSSRFNKDIKVIKVGKTLKLIVNGLVQSYNNSSGFAKRRVWGRVVATIKREAPEIKNVLVLGMGAGTMVHLLDSGFANLQITSVEIDQVIVDVAIKYFDLSELDNNKIIVADAYDVVKNPKKYKLTPDFDCVIVDTYCGDVYPSNISDKNFLIHLFEMLDLGTFVIFNRVFLRSETDKVRDFKEKLKVFMNSPEVTRVNCHGVSDNYLFHGVKKS